MNDLDTIDLHILDWLQRDGRISNSDLAARVGLAPPTVLRRVKLLEERGYIKGYTALLDPLALGLNVTAFVMVETTAGSDFDRTAQELTQLPGVVELHRLIGEWCFLLKVRTHSPQALDELVYRQMRAHPNVRRTLTTLATSTVLETPSIPLPTGQESEDDRARHT
jgi:Lrp/AsnC family leucine-responsive transcriptional regulator